MIEFRVFIGIEDHLLRMPRVHFLHQPRHCQSRNVIRAWDMSPYPPPPKRSPSNLRNPRFRIGDLSVVGCMSSLQLPPILSEFWKSVDTLAPTVLIQRRPAPKAKELKLEDWQLDSQNRRQWWRCKTPCKCRRQT